MAAVENPPGSGIWQIYFGDDADTPTQTRVFESTDKTFVTAQTPPAGFVEITQAVWAQTVERPDT